MTYQRIESLGANLGYFILVFSASASCGEVAHAALSTLLPALGG